MAEKSVTLPAPLSLSFSVALLAALLFGAVLAGSAREARREEAAAVAATLRPGLEAALAAGDREKAALLLEMGRGTLSAALYDTGGALAAGAPRPGAPGRPVPPLPPRVRLPSKLPWRGEYSYPLEDAASGALLGSLTLRDDTPWAARLAVRLAVTVAALAAGAAALGLLIGRGASHAEREAGAAAEEVTGMARAVAVHHNYRARATARAPLAEAVNEMLASIGRRDAEREAERRRAAEQVQAFRATVDRLEREKAAVPAPAASSSSSPAASLDPFRPELEAALRGIVDEAALLRDRLSEPHRRAAASIGRHGAHLLAVLRDADPAAAAAEGPLDLAEMLDQLSAVFAARAAERGLGFSFDAVGALPNVRGHAALLRRALVALAADAFRRTARGRVELAVGPLRDRFRFELRDTAPPLPAPGGEDDPRAAAGLAEAAGLVGTMGGELKFRVADAGNTFWFDLPLAPVTR